MYKQNATQKTTIRVNTSYVGETIEQKVMRITNNKEPITDGAPLIYTDRSEGVNPMYDIRTDRFELAVELSDKANKSKMAQREQMNGERTFDTMNEEQQKEFHKKFPKNKHNKQKDGGPEPAQGTQNAK